MTFKHMGTVISGTMCTEDWLQAFADKLEELLKEEDHPGNLATLGELIREARECDLTDTENTSGIVDELAEALNDYAPEYCYFGHLDGDGADMGFWLGYDWQERMKEDDVLIIDAGSDTGEYRGAICFITDHGNAAFGYIGPAGTFTEVWSVV